MITKGCSLVVFQKGVTDLLVDDDKMRLFCATTVSLNGEVASKQVKRLLKRIHGAEEDADVDVDFTRSDLVGDRGYNEQKVFATTLLSIT
eukprot:CAMPEP_0119011650 /NCGR_PEP_ID=MMETSP1176-20130426/5808_1 /TAXON_ID=265551 /ORGANISM="Synedropsis recta cf, Strain CCMP1620" /LENGTH=89 /DNA_ID=CAMNT_0006964507 /DNA_START=212 /DNA_END=481 /DNA_ORIENTATION=-